MMAIAFDCVCGIEIEALDGQAGRRVVCPGCRSDLTVPRRSTARRPEPVPDLGIDLASPVRPNLNPGKRKARRRPSAWDEGMLEALPRLLRLVGGAIGALFLLVVVWGLFFAPGRAAVAPPEAPVDRSGLDESVDVAERDRVDARAEAEPDQAAAGAKEARLRAAARVILDLPRGPVSRGVTIFRSEELPGGGFAFLARQNPFSRVEDGQYVEYPGGIVEAYLVEGGAPILVSEDRFAWEVETPEDLAATWADRARDDGPYRVVSAARTDFPATLTALVVNRQTGRRYRLLAEDVTTASAATIAMTPLDE
jgi:hypothetical protein